MKCGCGIAFLCNCQWQPRSTPQENDSRYDWGTSLEVLAVEGQEEPAARGASTSVTGIEVFDGENGERKN